MKPEDASNSGVGLATLPTEMIDLIYDHVHEGGWGENVTHTIANMRAACRNLAHDSESHLYRRVHFILHPRSVEKLVWISHNHPKAVKELIFEDVTVKSLFELERDHSRSLKLTAKKAKKGLTFTKEDRKIYDDWSKYVLQYQKDEGTLKVVINAIRQFANLETFRFHSGFEEMRRQTALPRRKKAIAKLLHVTDHTSSQNSQDYNNNLWDDRGSSRIFVTRTSGLVFWEREEGPCNSSLAYHVMFLAAVAQAPRLTTMSISTVLPLGLGSWGLDAVATRFMVQGSSTSNVKTLEIEFTEQDNCGGSAQMVGEIKISTLVKRAAFFENLETLRLVGSGIDDDGILDLQGLGHGPSPQVIALGVLPVDTAPHFPNLKFVDLKNVALSPQAVDYLCDQPISLKLENTMWFWDSFQKLSQVTGKAIVDIKIRGLQVFDIDLDAFRPSPEGGDESLQRARLWVVAHRESIQESFEEYSKLHGAVCGTVADPYTGMILKEPFLHEDDVHVLQKHLVEKNSRSSSLIGLLEHEFCKIQYGTSREHPLHLSGPYWRVVREIEIPADTAQENL